MKLLEIWKDAENKYASLCELTQEKVKQIKEVTEKVTTAIKNATRKYDVNSFENSEEFCTNNPDLKAFWKEWQTYSQSQFEALKKRADKGDAIAQYKIGYIISCGRISRAEKARGCQQTEWDKKAYEITSRWLDDEENRKYLDLSAQQGLGLAMETLVKLYTDSSSWPIGAVHWLHEYKKVCPWSSSANLIIDKFNQSRKVYGVESVVDFQKALKEKTEELQKLKRQYDYYESECRSAQYWEKTYKAERDELEVKCYRLERSASSSSSSRSSSRSSRDEKVQVRVHYSTDSNIWRLFIGNGQIVTMTKAEYKKLLNDSQKARKAFVQAKFNIPDSIKITGIEISLV